MKQRNEFSAKRSRIPTQAAYFITLSTTMALLPTLVIHLRALGFPGLEIGLLIALLLLVFYTGTVAWRGLAGVTRQPKRLLLIAIYSSIVLLLLIPFIRSFIYLTAALSALACALGAVKPLLDYYTAATTGQQHSHYGNQWLWGLVGWGLAAPWMTWQEVGYDVETLFFAAGLLLYFALLAVDQIPKSRSRSWQVADATIVNMWMQHTVALDNRMMDNRTSIKQDLGSDPSPPEVNLC